MDEYMFLLESVDVHPDGDWIWLAASAVGFGDEHLGLYIERDGTICTTDQNEWDLVNDIRALGLDPDSAEGEQLAREWKGFAREAGLKRLGML